MISRPWASSALAFASIEKAVSVPKRSIRLASFTPILLYSGPIHRAPDAIRSTRCGRLRPPLHHTPWYGPTGVPGRWQDARSMDGETRARWWIAQALRRGHRDLVLYGSSTPPKPIIGCAITRRHT